jgi:hypothetical protein
VICASVAPRRFIHAHEFAWDRERDPVWKRYQKIWDFYGAQDNLAFTHGTGALTSKDPPGSHCNNIGPLHRANIHRAFAAWFGIKAIEAKDRRSAEELACWTPAARDQLKPPSIFNVMMTHGVSRMADSIPRCLRPTKGSDVDATRRRWNELFGAPVVISPAGVKEIDQEKRARGTCVTLDINTEREIRVPATLMLPAIKEKAPCVVAFAQAGRSTLLKERSQAFEKLLADGVAVCVVDLRGFGETRPGSSRGRGSSATSISASEQMLGGSIIEGQLRDLAAVLGVLADRPKIDAERIALWGESFAEPNIEADSRDAPLDAEKLPRIGEPAAGDLAELATLFLPGIQAVVSRGGLFHHGELVGGPSIYLPHDSLLPGIVAAGDRFVCYGFSRSPALRVERPIDSRNRVAKAALEPRLPRIQEARTTLALPPLEIQFEYSPDADIAAWLAKALMK